jgi:hypothetical protein
MTTYVINPITNELESAQPRQTVGDKFKLQTFVRDRFALGGGVIQGEKVDNRENFAKPEIATSRIEQRKDGTFAVRTKYKSTERYPDGTLKAKYYTFDTLDEAKDFLKEIRDDLFNRAKSNIKVKKNINSWTEKFFKDNIKKFKVSDYDSFVKKMQKDWAQELKNNSGKYKSEQIKFVSDSDGLPRTEEMEVFGVKSPKKGQIETHGPGVAYYQRAFFKGKLDTDAKLRSGLKEYMQWSLSKGEGQPAAYKADRRDFLKAAQGLDNFDKNVLYFLGEGYDQFKYGQGGANFKNIMDKKFPVIFPKYHKKINLSQGEYTKNLKKVSDLAGVEFSVVLNNIKKENAKVKQILKLDKLPPDMKTGYSGDHLGGIKTAILTNDKNFARKVLENVIGSTRQRNTELGYKLLEQPKNRLVKKYLKAKTRAEKQIIVNDINKLIQKYDPGTQEFFIGKGGRLDFRPLKIQKTPEEKAKGYQEAAKKFFPASTVKKLKEMGVNLFTKLEKGSRTRKQFEALIPGKFDAAVLTPYDYITSIAAGYSIPESSLIAASNLLPRNVQKILPSMLGLYDIQKEMKGELEPAGPLFNLGDGEETKTGKKIRTTIEDLIGKVKDKFGDDSIGTADDVQEPESAERRRMFEEANERLGNIDEMEISDIDNPFMAAMGGRVGFKDGTPPVIPGNEPDYSELQVMLDNPDKYNTFPKGTFTEELDKAVYGTNEERNLLQKFNSMFLDPRVYPYYAQKIASGAANIPELAFRFPAALAYLYGQGNLALASGDLDRIKGKTLVEALEILDPKYTREIKNTKFGDVVGISDKSMDEQDKTEGQKFVGDTFQLAAEAVGPATPLFLFKMFPKLPKQIKDLVGTASAAEKVNKEIEKNMAVDQTRRDLILTIGAGGAAAALKFLGLDKLIKAPKATKAVTSAVKSGGTPQYFFDFVDLIKRKGKDVSDRQAVVERQKVIEYKDYTLTDTDGYITIRKTDEDMGRDEMMEYKPPEGVVDEATGKSTEVPAQYEEVTAKPDANDPGNFDADQGFDSIEDVLDELSKDGKKYTVKELEEMGIILDSTIKTEMAEGGIIAGVKSGPAPKSGPTPHGLPYLAKNVTPIKERK